MIYKLNRILNHMLDGCSFIDGEDIDYNPENFPFSRQDFRDVFNQLEELAGVKLKFIDNGHGFPEYVAFFNYNGVRFVWRLLIGQGSATQLMLADSNKFDIEYDQTLEVAI